MEAEFYGAKPSHMTYYEATQFVSFLVDERDKSKWETVQCAVGLTDPGMATIISWADHILEPAEY